MFCAMDLLNAMENSSLCTCNSTAMNLQSVRDRLRLEWDCSAGAKEKGERRWSEWTEVGLIDDAYTVRSLSQYVDSSLWNYIVRDPSCQLTLNIKDLNFEYVTSPIHSSIFYRLAQAHPPQCCTLSSNWELMGSGTRVRWPVCLKKVVEVELNSSEVVIAWSHSGLASA